LVLLKQTIAKSSNNILKTVGYGSQILYLFNNFWQRIVLRVFSTGSRAWRKKETERESGLNDDNHLCVRKKNEGSGTRLENELEEGNIKKITKQKQPYLRRSDMEGSVAVSTR
jgi:hypothetical protein